MESGIENLSTTASSNQPAASDNVSGADDEIRGTKAFLRQLVTKGSDIASASTITPASTAAFFDVTGTTGITAIGSTNSWDGRIVWFQFDGAVTLTHSSTLKLPGAVNYTTAAGDVLAFVQETSGTWRCVQCLPVSFTSSEQSLVSGPNEISVSHGRSTTPTRIDAYLICKSAEIGYSIGDIIPVGDRSGNATGIGLMANASNIIALVAASQTTANWIIYNRTADVYQACTSASWRLVIKGWWD